MALSLSLQKLLKTKTMRVISVCLLEKSQCTFAPFQLSYPKLKWWKCKVCLQYTGAAVGKKDSVTPVKIKCVNNSRAWFWVDVVLLPPHILISRHTKPEVVSRAEWTPHEGCLCPQYISLLTVQRWLPNSVSPRRCQCKRAGDSLFITLFVFVCVLACTCLPLFMIISLDVDGRALAL